MLGMPHWEDDPDFSIDHHLHHATLPEPGDEAALQTFVERKMQEPIDRSRPLWHFYVIDGYQGGSVVVSRFHHALADGIALAEVLLSLTDAEPDDDLLPRRAAPRPARRRARAAAHQPAGGRGPVRPPAHRPGVGRPARCAERARRGAGRAAPVVRRRGAHHRVADRADRRQAAARAQPRVPVERPSRPRQARGLVAGTTAGRHQAGRARRRRHRQRRARGRRVRRDQPLRRRPRWRPRGPVDDGPGQRPHPRPAAPPRARQQVRAGDAAAADVAAGTAAAPRRVQAPDGLDQALPRGRAHLRPAHRDRAREHRRGQAGHRLLRGEGDRGHHQRGRAR